MDRGLLQREAAQEIGVSEATLYNWETGRVADPEVRHLPKTLAFLGYDPRIEPEDLPGRCRWRREALGLSQRAFALRLGLDPTSIMRVETGKRIGPRLRGKIEEFLSKQAGEASLERPVLPSGEAVDVLAGGRDSPTDLHGRESGRAGREVR